MLKGIHPLRNADVLFARRAIADANFPSDSAARQTRLGKLLRIDNTSAPAEAVLSVMALDSFVDESAARKGGLAPDPA